MSYPSEHGEVVEILPITSATHEANAANWIAVAADLWEQALEISEEIRNEELYGGDPESLRDRLDEIEAAIQGAERLADYHSDRAAEMAASDSEARSFNPAEWSAS